MLYYIVHATVYILHKIRTACGIFDILFAVVVHPTKKIINHDIEMVTHHTYVLQSWILSMKIKYDEF